MRKIYLLVLGLLFFYSQSIAQSIKNIAASAKGSQVTITYDLEGSEAGQKFDVVIKSSKDNFTAPLKEVTGDVGTNQTAGTHKTITWNARKELGAFKGDIAFEITATITFTPLKFIKPTTGAGVKIGKTYTVEWKGGDVNRNLKLELLKNNSQVMDMGNINNTGSYAWQVPKTMTKGGGFQLKLSDPTQPNDAIVSGTFQLKKIPIWVYIAPAALVAGGVAALLISNSSGGGGGEPGNSNPIADPPPPPGGGN